MLLPSFNAKGRHLPRAYCKIPNREADAVTQLIVLADYGTGCLWLFPPTPARFYAKINLPLMSYSPKEKLDAEKMTEAYTEEGILGQFR